ncbi:Nicotinamidase/isochorismatase family protein [Cronobacter muytjensii 530]
MLRVNCRFSQNLTKIDNRPARDASKVLIRNTLLRGDSMLTLNPATTALVVIDLQEGILPF